MKKLLKYNIINQSSRIGLLCNQTAWHASEKKYSFEWLLQKNLLKKVFKSDWKEVKARLQEEEAARKKEAAPSLIYKLSLQQLKIK